MLSMHHDSRFNGYRSPFGAIAAGTMVFLSIDVYDTDISGENTIEEAELLTVFYDAKHNEIANAVEARKGLKLASKQLLETEYGKRVKMTYSAEICPEKAGVLCYAFRFITTAGEVLIYGDAEDGLGGVGKLYHGIENAKLYGITVYGSKGGRTPKWASSSVIYQIFPDRFRRAEDKRCTGKKNAFYYSDWDDSPCYIKEVNSGRILRWDFQQGNLKGVTEKISYIKSLGANLVYLNPVFSSLSNHRYDTYDYMHVDGMLGGDEAFNELMSKAKESDLKIILDGVFSHTGKASIYFDDGGKGEGAYHNKQSKYRSWYKFKSEDDDDDYDCWWGEKTMPETNELDRSYLNFIVKNKNSVVKHWMRTGISGFRLDVADELPDDFLEELQKAVAQTAAEDGREGIVLGEVWEDASRKVSYDCMRSYFTRGELNTVTNYPFRDNLLAFFGGRKSGAEAERLFMSLEENYPKENFYAAVNMTGTHDSTRLMTEMLKIACDRKDDAEELVKAYAAVMFTFPGIPLIYYGDETGLIGGKDPENRGTYPWGHENHELIEHFRALGALRQSNRVLTEGAVVYRQCLGGRGLAFERTLAGEDSFILAIKPEYETGPFEIDSVSFDSCDTIMSGKYFVILKRR